MKLFFIPNYPATTISLLGKTSYVLKRFQMPNS